MLETVYGDLIKSYALEDKLVLEVAEENSDPIAYYFVCTDEKLVADMLRLFNSDCYRVSVSMKESDVDSRKLYCFNLLYKKYISGQYYIRKSVHIKDLSGANAPNRFEITAICDKISDTKYGSTARSLHDAIDFVENGSYIIKE